MENSFQTSFIPKKPIIENGLSSGGGRRDRTTSISMVFSLSLLIIMAASTGGLYFYKGYLQKNKEQLSSSLFKVRDSFDKDTITELEMYDKRTTVAKVILDRHIVMSPVFEVINELTLSSVQYTKFSQERKEDVFSVRMSGVARDYKSIALQADVFNTGKGQMFKDLIFSNLTKNKNNYVTFDLEFTVDPALLSYSNNITSAKPAAKSIPVETTVVQSNQNIVPGGTSDSGQPLQTNNGIQ